ncbi:hypothetical protein PR202_gb13283 [Eleusine coracana subsp. coracana]|uniref:Uncharacterized protein n=1 Tax=Eleusine coracana subsp. coracana TaxID=191504 RepID=A0AAV5ETD2_ELECO|nr:hypothetical protein PR202_gb13283 [Eleusine coracana subsp. coracana]
MSVSLGLGTARQQLAHAPNVRVDKKKRAQTVPEVAAPDLALDEAERFVGKSLFRKVAHVQDDRSLAAGGVADPVTDYPGRKAVTLKGRGRGDAWDPAGEGGRPRQGLQEEQQQRLKFLFFESTVPLD